MSLLVRTATLISVLTVLAPAVALAAEDAQVSVRIAELRVNPSSEARTRLKIGSGRNVSVLGKSSDGQWVQIRTEVDRGGDSVKFEGWVFASCLRTKNGPMGSGSEPKAVFEEAEDVTSDDSSDADSSSGDADWNSTGSSESEGSSDVASSQPAWESTPAEPPAQPESTDEPADSGSSSDWDAFE